MAIISSKKKEKACLLIDWSHKGKRGREPISYKSSIDEDLKAAACILLMLSSDHNNTVFPTTTTTTTTNLAVATRKGHPETEKHRCGICGKCFGSYQALGGHRSSHFKYLKTTHVAANHVQNQSQPKPKPKPQPIDDDDDDINEIIQYKLERSRGSRKQIQALMGGHYFGLLFDFDDFDFDDDDFDDDDDEDDEAVLMMKKMRSSNKKQKKKVKIFQCSVCQKILPSGQALGGHKRLHWVANNKNIINGNGITGNGNGSSSSSSSFSAFLPINNHSSSVVNVNVTGTGTGSVLIDRPEETDINADSNKKKMVKSRLITSMCFDLNLFPQTDSSSSDQNPPPQQQQEQQAKAAELCNYYF